MNELRFLEVMGKIDDDLIKEADIDIDQQCNNKPAISKRNIYAFGSVAAAAAITIGSVAFYNAHNPADLLSNSSIIQSDNNDDNLPKDNSAISTASTEAEKTTSTSKDSTTNKETTADNTDKRKETASNINSKTSVEENPTNSAPADNLQNDPPSSSDNNSSQPTDQNTEEHKGGVAVDNAYYRPFTATVDPDYDDYGDDELHHIDVRTADGFYRQLKIDEYAVNGISSSVCSADFGGYIGIIIEVNDLSYHGNSVESQEPTLAGADVYYYAPTGNNKAYIIVKKNEQCSIFIADGINESVGFRKGLAFFDVKNANDILCIEYRITVPDGSQMITSVQSSISDAESIRVFYELLCQLQPEDYSNLPDHVGTPQWLVDAWANYDSDPNAPEREDYSITIKLKDGTILQDIRYQPYLGNGYVENMQELTPEQNDTLRNLFH